MKRISVIALLGTLLGGCGTNTSDPLEGVNSIIFLQRAPRPAGGDVFQYTSYAPGARLVELSPPTADGTLTELCCSDHPEFSDADISGYDLSFDAREVVLAAKLSGDQSYGLFLLSLESGEVNQLPTDPNRDYVMPIFLPGDRIMYMTNAVVEEGAPQFRDEYERGVTTQIGIINKDGTDEELGARNLSHRVFPTLLSDGRVLFTQWDHLGDMNAGHLVTANPDMTTVREAFGKERTGVTNSYIKAVEVAPGRVVAIGSSRDRTLQSGTLLDIRLGKVSEADGELRADRDMAEANASYRILTPQVPLDRQPSSPTIGRYYDAYPLNAGEYLDLLVTWGDGPMESGTLAAAGLTANFGIYLYDTKRNARRPIWDDEDMWDVFPRPLAPRDAPPVIESSGTHEYGDVVLLGSMNVYESSQFTFADDAALGVRVREGFSGEEGVGRDFGLTEHEGAAILGIAPVHPDGSWAAKIPANIPVAQQVIDRFGMALASEPVWISGKPGESRFCGGCHEPRDATTVINPGVTTAAANPADLMSTVGRTERVSSDFGDHVTNGAIVGVPWDQSLQPIFDAKCVSCHDGTDNGMNPSYTITDTETGDQFTWTFNLTGEEVDYGIGEVLLSGYSASHLSIMGPDVMELTEAGLDIDIEPPVYIEPTRARDSRLIQVLNPPQLFAYDDDPESDTYGQIISAYDPAVRAFPDLPHGEEHDFTLTPAEHYLFILAADNGGQFYSRENAPGNNY